MTKPESLVGVKISNLKANELVGLGDRSLDRLKEVESLLVASGVAEGLPIYLLETEASLRELEGMLAVGRHAIKFVFDHYQIPRLSQKEASAKALKKTLEIPEIREKVKKLNREKMKRLAADPQVQRRKLEKMREAAQRPEVLRRKSEIMKERWTNQAHRERMSKILGEAARKRWQDPDMRERMTRAIKEARRLKYPDDGNQKDRERKRKGLDPEELTRRRKIAGARLGELMKDPVRRAHANAVIKSKWADPEYRAYRMSRIARITPEAKAKTQEKRSASLKKHWENPEFKERKSRSARESNNRPEVKKKKSEAMKRKWQDPVFRDKRLKELREMLQDEEYQQKRLAGLHQRWSDPEYRITQAERARQVITELNKDPKQLQKAAEAIRTMRADPRNVSRFHLPTIQGYRRDIGYYSQSAWEANFARVLKLNCREFYAKESFMLKVPQEYSSIFHFEITQFTLDFIVEDPRGNLVAYDLIAHPLEDPVGIAKAEIFVGQFPEITLHIIDEDLYDSLKKRFQDKINSDPNLCGWETSQDNLRNNPDKYK